MFLGRHLVEVALARGDDVTLFTRGRTNPDLFPQARRIVGDRDGDLSGLARGDWDAVVDTSGYFPRVVRASAERLAGHVGHYTFVSTGSVYADTSQAGVDEGSLVHELARDAPEELTSPELYGGHKAACEGVVEHVLGGRALSVRAGLIVGPWDTTNRFTYWVRRIATGGEVLAPEPRTQPVQFIDARDLCEWILRMAEEGRGGVFNATGPERPYTLEGALDGIREAVGSDATFTWVDERFLVDAGVEPFQDLPLWLAPSTNADFAGFLALDVSHAVAAGLRFRPLEETVLWTLEWARTSSTPEKTAGVALSPAGIDAKREVELLRAWRTRAAA